MVAEAEDNRKEDEGNWHVVGIAGRGQQVLAAGLTLSLSASFVVNLGRGLIYNRLK